MAGENTSAAAASRASKDSDKGGEKEYGEAGKGFGTAGVELKLLFKESNFLAF